MISYPVPTTGPGLPSGMTWTAEPADASKCWADDAKPFTNELVDCGRPADTDIGLCSAHYEELFGLTPSRQSAQG